jgi:cell division inhibitor SulA
MPLLAALTNKENARWCTWVAPPHEPFAPALAAHGVALEKILVVRTDQALWAFEQALVLGACEVALGWVGKVTARSLRRLQLAAERGRTLGVLFRAQGAAREPSCAVLRLWVEPAIRGIRLRLLKSRGGQRDWVTLSWSEVHACDSS